MTTVASILGINPKDPSAAELLKHARNTPFKKGTIILNPYDDNDNVYILLSGMVKAYTVNARREESIVIMYGPGEIFPIGWILGLKRTPMYFEAMSYCEVAILPQHIFHEQVQKNVAISYKVLTKVLDQFRLYVSRINNLEYKYGRERLAYRLLVLATRFGTEHDNTIVIPYIGQQDLGATLNMSRESVNREISRFEKQGFIKYGRENIIIYDQKGLRKELGEDVSIMFFDAQA